MAAEVHTIIALRDHEIESVDLDLGLGVQMKEIWFLHIDDRQQTLDFRAAMVRGLHHPPQSRHSTRQRDR